MTSVMVGQKVQPGSLCDWEGEAPAEPQLRENLAPSHAARQEPRPPELADSQSGQAYDITTSKSRVASGLVKPRDRILEKSRFPCGQQREWSVGKGNATAIGQHNSSRATPFHKAYRACHRSRKVGRATPPHLAGLSGRAAHSMKRRNNRTKYWLRSIKLWARLILVY